MGVVSASASKPVARTMLSASLPAPWKTNSTGIGRTRSHAAGTEIRYERVVPPTTICRSTGDAASAGTAAARDSSARTRSVATRGAGRRLIGASLVRGGERLGESRDALGPRGDGQRGAREVLPDGLGAAAEDRREEG